MKNLLTTFIVLFVFSTTCIGDLCGQGSEDLQAQFDKLEADFAEQSLRIGNKAPRKANRKLRAESSQQALELLEECEDADLAVEILNWVVSQNRANKSYRKAHQVMVESYLDQPGIGNVFSESTPIEILNSALEKNLDDGVRAVVIYHLALKEQDAVKARKSLTELDSEYGQFRYRGTAISLLVAIQLNALKAQERSADRQLKFLRIRGGGR